MKHQLLVSALWLIAHSIAHDFIEAPYNLQLQNTQIPKLMAQSLLLKDSDYSKYTSHPDNRFEQFYVHQNNHTEQFLCSVPPQGSTKPLSHEQEPDVKLDSDILAKATKIIHNSFSQGSCVWEYDLRGFYWTYGYCHGDKIIQYHETAPLQERKQKHLPGAPDMVYVLGRFSKASAKEVKFSNEASPLQYHKFLQGSEGTFRLVNEKMSPFSHRQQKVVMQMATDGSLCDMTRQPRLTEIVYKCNANGGKRVQILDVEEIKTCHYRMFIHVPGLCQLEAFVPDKLKQDLVDVTCQKISDDDNYSLHGLTTFEEYLEHPILRQDLVFPVRADNKINVAQHEMSALGRGFYLAKYMGKYQTQSDFYNNRNVILYNGFYESMLDLNTQLGRTIFNAVGKKLLAPEFVNNEQQVLQWKHLFILWFEVYNYKGEFIGLSRLEHDGLNPQVVLGAQMLDPVSLRDVDSDDSLAPLYERPLYQAPHNMWNYEKFSSRGVKLAKPEQKKAKDELLVKKVKTVIVYNEGEMEDGRPNILVFDEEKDEQLPGQYDRRGEYVFQMVVGETQTETFTAPQIPNVEFLGFPVTYFVKSEDEPETVTVTKTASTGEVEKVLEGETEGEGETTGELPVPADGTETDGQESVVDILKPESGTEEVEIQESGDQFLDSNSVQNAIDAQSEAPDSAEPSDLDNSLSLSDSPDVGSPELVDVLHYEIPEKEIPDKDPQETSNIDEQIAAKLEEIMDADHDEL